MSNMIEVHNVTKIYDGQTVLRDIRVDFDRGKIHGIVGRNGSGKSVLFKCIVGFVRPTSGTIAVGGKQVGKDTDIPPGIGMIINAPGFLPDYSGYKNLEFLAMINQKIKKEDIYRAIERVGLEPKNRKKVGKYSMGMKQRLGLAQAIMEDPPILILDEPFNGLDHSGVDEMRELLRSLRAGSRCIILSSHNQADIDILCDTVHEMDAGKIRKTR